MQVPRRPARTSYPGGTIAMARRVVIAEDEAIIRLDLKEILESEG
ncbi:MAG: response regulator, partial [Acidimicrobiales bacterium]